ncbi:hypothetical protein F8M41_004351 [Gigaspora margarita]|uniref:Uncharacterized protein n=1 Tax=Gigaspora margarita TaxID=4874 RepID=A0A8H4A7Q3_GIGMA|nr:hypothetical protein F8M41_004351 [Gigaspora margarita]
MCQYIAGNRAGHRTRTGAQYFEEFCSHFWERPEILSMMSRRELTTTQRDHSASPDCRVSSNRRVSTNNNENNEGENRPEGSLLHNTAPERRPKGSLLRND